MAPQLIMRGGRQALRSLRPGSIPRGLLPGESTALDHAASAPAPGAVLAGRGSWCGSPVALWRPLSSSAGPPGGMDVASFILGNYTPYDGDASFLAGPTERTTRVWDKCAALVAEEHRKGVLDCDYQTPASIVSHGPGYIDPELDLVVGFQADAPLKRLMKPKGGGGWWRPRCGATASPWSPGLKEIYTWRPLEPRMPWRALKPGGNVVLVCIEACQEWSLRALRQAGNVVVAYIGTWLGMWL